MPMGKISFPGGLLRSFLASTKRESSSEGLAVWPINPMPPARETAVAREAPAKTRMGAPIMRGEVIHG